MISNYKVKIFIPGGRQKYMELLLPRIFNCNGFNLIDEIMILNNTRNIEDKEYIKTLDNTNKIKVYYNNDISGNNAIFEFYNSLKDKDTIYIKIDDDIVYIDNNFIKNLLEFRIKHTEYFLVYPIIINNAYSNLVQEKLNKPHTHLVNIDMDNYTDAWCDYLCKNGFYGNKVHKDFLKHNVNEYLSEDIYEFNTARMSINAICFFGKDMHTILDNNIIKEDEKEFTLKFTQMYNWTNCIYCNCLCSHFSFGWQEKHINNSVLQAYKYLK